MYRTPPLPAKPSVCLPAGRILFTWVVLFSLGITLGAQNSAAQVENQDSSTVLRPQREAASIAGTFYVATNGNDSWSGTLPVPNLRKTDGPFASLARAQIAVEALLQSNYSGPISVLVRNGTYYLPLSSTNPGTLSFSAADSGTAQAPVTWENYPLEVPVISGGVPVTNWKYISGALWQASLPGNLQPFEYLYYNGERRLRSRLQSADGVGYYMHGGACISTQSGQTVNMELCNLGTFLRVAATVPPTGANANCPNVSDGTTAKCLDRFQYDPDDPITQWINLNPPKGNQCNAPASGKYPPGDIGLTLIDAYAVDVMRVSCVDTVNNIIYLTGATQGSSTSYSYYGPVAGHRYMVENTRDAFNTAQATGQTGIWFLDRSTSPWTLNYLANYLENPKKDTVVIPQLGGVIPGAPATDYVGGSLLFATGLQNVTFSGLVFEADNFISSSTGYNNDTNEEFALPQAVDCESCQNVVFDGVIVRHTSASGLLIAGTGGNSGAPAINDVIRNSAFYDIGSTGIRIGHSPSGGDRPQYVPQLINVENNLVQGYSRVFADGEGIAMGNGHDVAIQYNDVNDGYHAGVSICSWGCFSFQYSANGINVLTQYNHIWNIIQGVTSDGGALYYNVGGPNGSGTGDQILNNLIHDVSDAGIIDTGVVGSGYGGHGIYIDMQSAGVEVANNVVYRVSSGTFTMTQGPASPEPANTFVNNIGAYARRGMWEESNPWPENCTNTLRANITRNIFNFDLDEGTGFQAIATCSDSCGMPFNQFQNFAGNLYWRNDGGFASDTSAFSVLTNPPPPNQASQCNSVPNPSYDQFTFAQWQNSDPVINGVHIKLSQDNGGTASVNPGFRNTGQPSDFLLSQSPLTGFNIQETNSTILNAGRNNPLIEVPPVLETYPTYTYSDQNF